MARPSSFRAWVVLVLVFAAGLAETGCGWYRRTRVLRVQVQDYRDMPAKVVDRELRCDLQPQPYVRVERLSFFTDRARRGNPFAYRLVYAMCGGGEPLDVQVRRRILHDGELVHQDFASKQLKPGRWIMDDKFGIPREAETGAYELEIQLSGAYEHTERKPFRVVSW